MRSIRYPVPRRFRFMKPDEIPNFDFEVVEYQLKQAIFGESYELFYECTHRGCSGAGCPTFSRELQRIPENVDLALREHAKRHSPDFIEEFIPIKPQPTPEEWDATCLRLVDRLEEAMDIDDISGLMQTTEMRRKINARKHLR